MMPGPTPLPTPDFRALFEAVPGLYLVLLPDPPLFTIVVVSDAYLRATMTERGAILGRGLFEVFPDNPDDPAATGVSNLNASLHSVLQNRTPHTMAVQKYDIRRPDSEGGGFEERHWSPVNSPVFGADGETAYILHRVEDVTEFVRLEEHSREERKLAREIQAEAEQRAADNLLRAEGLQEANSQLRKTITERRNAEEALRRAQEFRDRVLESTTLGVLAMDLEGRITLANPSLAAMLGYTVEEIVGHPFSLIVSPDELAAFTERFHTAIYGEPQVQDVETSCLRKDGQVIAVSTCGSPLTVDGKSIGMVVTLQDITERKRHEQEELAVMSSARCLIWYSDAWDSGRHDLHWELHPMNESAAQRLLPLDVPLGKTHVTAWTESHLPGERQRMDDVATQRVLEGQSYTQEFRCRNRYGEIQWLKEDVHVETVAPGRWRIVGVTTDITERKRAEEALRESEERTRLIVETALDAVVTMDAQGMITGWNAQAEAIFGWPREEAIGQSLADTIIPAHYREAHRQGLRHFLATGEGPVLNKRIELTALHRSGREFPIELTVSPVVRTQTVTFSAFIRDLTEHKHLQEQLLQSQKMEGIGRLAGGIAHDFNNLLTAIMGYAEFAADKVSVEDSAYQDLLQIQQAAERAAELTRQLLAFARRQVIQPRIIGLNDLVHNLDKMLRRLIGEDIELVTLMHPDLWAVKVDPGQIEQVLVNLAVNARDAMSQGGKLTLETANVTLDADYARGHSGVTPGEYVMLAVTDTGAGIPEEIQSRIFEPFFTTKEQGKGTGLGLATVFGIVKQSGGDIWLYSEPEHGTTFKIYLPRVPAPTESLSVQKAAAVAPRGTETILVAEDEALVRQIAVQTLRGLGYTVLEASSGGEALIIAWEHAGEIQLLVTDVVMPQMSGKMLAERLREARPGIRVLFASGYTDNAIVHHGVLDPGILFLQKPFTPLALARKVREALDA